MIEIRTCGTVDDLCDAANPIAHYLGHPRPTEAWATTWLRNFDLPRMHMAVDRRGIIGGAGAFSLEMTVPGGRTLATAGVTNVGVLPTHRRRGILRALMRAQLDDVHARDEPLAAMWPSEETIYGRYGYGLASFAMNLRIAKVYSAFRSGVDSYGDARLVDAEDSADLIQPIYDAVRTVTPGMCARSTEWWRHRVLRDPVDVEDPHPKACAVLEVDGEPKAYALYRLRSSMGEIERELEVQAQEVMAVTPDATASMWRYLLDIDWAKAVVARFLPPAHPVVLLLARPRQARPALVDGLWIRLVDVATALSRRSYSRDDVLILDVRDDFCPWNAGRWRLEAGSVTRTTATAEIALDVADLAMVYLGGFTFRELWHANLIQELRGGAVERADSLFRTDVGPWCSDNF
jgi:predicted acetyltransferase